MSTRPVPDPLFAGAGELGRAMAETDWAATPLGPPAGWPVELRSVVRILLTSRFSMWMAWGPDLTMFYNDAYRRDTLRTKHPWALGRPAHVVWAEIWDEVAPRITSVLETGESTWDEGLLLFLERSGYPEETYHTFSYSPLADGSGAIAGMLCVVSEDTVRVIGERRLRVLSELGEVSAVTSPTPEDACAAAVEVLARARTDVPFSAVYLLDEGGRTARRVALHGLRDDPTLAPLLHDREDRPDDLLWSVLDGGGPAVVDGLASGSAGRFAPTGHPGGERDPDRAVVLPLTGGGGDAPIGVVVAGVSPFRALDAEYRRFLDLVAGGVATAVADARAFQAQARRADELAELDRAKTEFFTGVSHELRTPLTLISGPAEDALGDLADPLSSGQRRRVELIQRNGGRLRRLVDALLEFSRLESGRAVPHRVAVDLAALTRGIAESFAPAITRAGLGLVIDCPPLPTAVSVDTEMWEKVLLNLLSNAAKYTLTGRVQVRLRADGDGVHLEVEDTGIGVPAGDLPLLFQRFHRVAGAEGRSHEGSGIGLALVAELAALHGGRAEVASTPGEGSRFTVRLPPDALTTEDAAAPRVSPTALLYRDEALQWIVERPTAASALPGVGATGGATVLVAEDNADLRNFLAGLLAPHYTVLLAADGTDALRQARTRRPDLVLTDVMMPGLDGFALLAALRSHPATATTPVVMLSARAGEESAIEGLSAGADDYLAKPFSSAELLARVRSNLELARVRNHESAWRSALVNAMQDGLFVLDAGGTVIESNAAFHAIVGWGSEGMPYAPPYPWWTDEVDEPDGATRARREFASILAEGRGSSVLPLRQRSGHRVQVEVSVRSVLDRDGATRVVVGTARDVTQRQRIADRDRLLADAGRLLAQPGDLAGRLDELVRAAVPVLGGLVAVLLTQPDGSQSVVAAHHRRPAVADRVRALGTVPFSEKIREQYAAGAAFVAPPGTCPLTADAAAGSDGAEPDGAEPDGAESGESLVVPLTAAGRAVGTLIVCDTAPAPDVTDVATAEELGRRIALAVESRRLAARERRLHELTAALAAAGTVAVAARVVVAGIIDLTGADSVAALIHRSDTGLELVHQIGRSARLGERYGRVRVAELPLVVDAVASGRAGWLREEDWAHAALPLAVGDRVSGVLFVTFPGPRAFDEDEQAFLRTLAGEAALAFERAVLADARRDLADTLQHSLLPPALPEHERLQLAARYLPAASGSRTGGDWYDVLVLDDPDGPAGHGDRVAIVVGDVVGQGPGAASVMGQLRSALSAYLLRTDSPAEALQWLDSWSNRVHGARASTVICVVVDTATGVLRWARAGHPPPLVIDTEGGTRYLSDATGTVLGVRAAPPFTEGSTVLVEGEVVLLYTDGLVERRGELVDDGFDRLARAAAGGGPLHRLVPAVLHAALDDTGPPDDIALVAARWRPGPLVGDRLAVPATLAAVRREIQRWGQRSGLGEDQLDDLQLAAGEAIANAAEHAYAGREPGRVRYRLEAAADGGVRAEIADDGEWRPPGDPGFRGRGLMVIGGLGRHLTVEHDERPGTRVRFTLPPEPDGVARPGAAARRPAAEPTAHAQVRVTPEAVVVTGELDLATVPALREPLLTAARPTGEPLVLDLTGVTYLASAGVSLLVDLLGTGSVRLLADPDGPVGRVLRLTGLDRHLVADET